MLPPCVAQAVLAHTTVTRLNTITYRSAYTRRQIDAFL